MLMIFRIKLLYFWMTFRTLKVTVKNRKCNTRPCQTS